MATAKKEPMQLLVEAVVAVMDKVQWVQKTGQNTQQKYSFASDADLITALRPEMVKNGLFIFPSAAEITQLGKTIKGTQGQLDIVMQYTLMHTSGASIEVVALGCGTDSLDKSPYKAQTGALKYALRGLFLIPTGDDPENEANIPKNDTGPGQQAVMPKEKPADKHHQSWAADRVKFCAYVGNLFGKSDLAGTKYKNAYEAISAFTEANMRGKRPSHMTQATRGKLVSRLESEDGREAFITWLGKSSEGDSQ